MDREHVGPTSCPGCLVDGYVRGGHQGGGCGSHELGQLPMDWEASTGVSASRSILGLEERQVSIPGPKGDWGVSSIQGAGRAHDQHLHFPDKDTEVQQDEGS